MFPFGVSFTKEVEVPLPDRFANIDEPSFARLMFEEGCSVSLAISTSLTGLSDAHNPYQSCQARIGTPYTALQKRLCDTCKDAQ